MIPAGKADGERTARYRVTSGINTAAHQKKTGGVAGGGHICYSRVHQSAGTVNIKGAARGNMHGVGGKRRERRLNINNYAHAPRAFNVARVIRAPVHNRMTPRLKCECSGVA